MQRVLSALVLLGMSDCSFLQTKDAMAEDINHGVHVSPKRLLRACVEWSPGSRSVACSALARTGSDAELVDLRETADVAEEIALLDVVSAGLAQGRDLRFLFEQKEPSEGVAQAVYRLVGTYGWLGVAFELALLCRERCAPYRRLMQLGVFQWTEYDWHRASVAAAVLGFLGHPDSESWLLAALWQRHSWVLAVTSARALSRLRTTTTEGRMSAQRAKQTHWSRWVRDSTVDVEGSGVSGYDHLSAVLSGAPSAGETFGDIWKREEPLFGLLGVVNATQVKFGRPHTTLDCASSAPNKSGPATGPAKTGARESALFGKRVSMRHPGPEDWDRLYVAGRGWKTWQDSVYDDPEIAPYFLLAVDQPESGAFPHLNGPAGPATVVYRFWESAGGRTLFSPIAEVPGNPLRARVTPQGRLILLTDFAAVVLDTGGVVGPACPDLSNQTSSGPGSAESQSK